MGTLKNAPYITARPIRLTSFILLLIALSCADGLAQSEALDSLLQRRGRMPTLDTSEFGTVDELQWLYATVDATKSAKYNDTLRMMLKAAGDAAADPLWYKNQADLLNSEGKLNEAMSLYDSAGAFVDNCTQVYIFSGLGANQSISFYKLRLSTITQR